MATIAQFNQDPNDPNQQGNPGGGGQVLNSTGGGGESQGGSAPAGQGAYSAPRQAQNTPPNINQYLQANQGAGQQLAGGITSNIQNQANQLSSNVNTANNSLDSKYQPLQQNLGDKGQQTIQTAFQNPQQLLDSYNQAKTQSSNQPLSSDQQNQADQYNQFQQLNSGGYNQDINAYGQAGNQLSNNLQNQYQNLAQQTGSAANEMGRNQLLQNTIGRPEYSQGQQTLDTLFLQAQPGVANQLKQNLGQIGSQAQQQVQGFTGDAQSKLAALQGLSSQDQQGIKNLFMNGSAQGTGLNQIGQNVQSEYEAGQKNAANTQALIAAGAKNNTLSADQLKQLGLTPGQQTWGLNDLTPYVSNNALTGNAQTATPEEFARYNALNQLAGGPNGLQTSIFGNQTKAGGYNPVGFDSQRFNTDVTNRQNTLNADYQTQVNDSLRHFNMNPVNSPSGTNFLNQVGEGVGAAAGGLLGGAAGSLVGNIGGVGSVPTGGVGVPIAQQLQAGLRNGTMTPDQAQQIIKSGTDALTKQYGDGTSKYNPQGFMTPFSSFENWYNGTYAPSSRSALGQTSADTIPMPKFDQSGRPLGK